MKKYIRPKITLTCPRCGIKRLVNKDSIDKYTNKTGICQKCIASMILNKRNSLTKYENIDELLNELWRE